MQKLIKIIIYIITSIILSTVISTVIHEFGHFIPALFLSDTLPYLTIQGNTITLHTTVDLNNQLHNQIVGIGAYISTLIIICMIMNKKTLFPTILTITMTVLMLYNICFNVNDFKGFNEIQRMIIMIIGTIISILILNNYWNHSKNIKINS